MAKFTKDQVKKAINMDPDDADKDLQGQIIIYHSIWEWNDGSYNDHSEYDHKQLQCNCKRQLKVKRRS